MNTPWGTSQDQTTFVRNGITSVSTPSHGGLMVRKAWAEAALSEAARALGTPWRNREGEWLCYEEDCAYAIVLWELQPHQRTAFRRRCSLPNQRTDQEYREGLRQTLSTYYAEYLIGRGDALDPKGYAEWERMREWDRREAERAAAWHKQEAALAEATTLLQGLADAISPVKECRLDTCKPYTG